MLLVMASGVCNIASIRLPETLSRLSKKSSSRKDYRRRKKAEQEQRTLVFVDEAGFYLLPMVVRTYALRGHTPVLRVKLTHDHLSAIGGITKTGRIL
jgi:hypothetical protein